VHSDCFVTPGWLPRLLSHFESSNKDIRIGAVVPMTNYANEGFAVYSQMLHDRFVEYKLPNKASPNESEIEAVVDRTYPSGLDAFAKGIRWRTPLVYSTDISSFCTAFSKEVFDECGMFDEAYTFRGYEDKDMRCRMERHGFEVWSAKNCFVHHFGNITSDGDGFCFPELMRRNRERFERTWMSA
jgi:GT2 family glycosyltransferase